MSYALAQTRIAIYPISISRWLAHDDYLVIRKRATFVFFFAEQPLMADTVFSKSFDVKYRKDCSLRLS